MRWHAITWCVVASPIFRIRWGTHSASMPYGYAAAFRGFAGNVSTRPEITRMLAEDIITDLAAAGPTHFILVDNHAGNDTALEVAARSLTDRLGVSIGHFYPWKVMTVWGPELFGDQWKAAFGHGAEPNTSVILRINDSSVTGGDPRVRPDLALGRLFVERCAQSLAQFIEWFRTQKTGGRST